MSVRVEAYRLLEWLKDAPDNGPSMIVRRTLEVIEGGDMPPEKVIDHAVNSLLREGMAMYFAQAVEPPMHSYECQLCGIGFGNLLWDPECKGWTCDGCHSHAHEGDKVWEDFESLWAWVGRVLL